MQCSIQRAVWCPRCGGCSCVRDPYGNGQHLSSTCPLHGDTSLHAIEQMAPTADWSLDEKAAYVGLPVAQLRAIRDGDAE